MYFKLLSLPAILLSLAACAPSSSVAPSENINNLYSTSGWTWSTRDAGIDFYFRVKRIGDKVGVCGAYTDRGGTRYSHLSERVADGAAVHLGGAKLTNSARFFRRHDRPHGMFGRQVNCIVTDLAWSREFGQTRPRLVHGKTSFR